MSTQHILSLFDSQDIARTRMQVRDAARRAGIEPGGQARISLAASSLMVELGLGHYSTFHSIAIEQLCEGKNKGLRVIFISSKSTELKSVYMAAKKFSWMVDDIAVHPLIDGQVEIILTKWAEGNGHDESA